MIAKSVLLLLVAVAKAEVAATMPTTTMLTVQKVRCKRSLSFPTILKYSFRRSNITTPSSILVYHNTHERILHQTYMQISVLVVHFSKIIQIYKGCERIADFTKSTCPLPFQDRHPSVWYQYSVVFGGCCYN